MIPGLHLYHLDDAPDLRSCNLIVGSLPGNTPPGPSTAIVDKRRLGNFYGRQDNPLVKYIREKKRLDYGKAHDDEYMLEFLEDGS